MSTINPNTPNLNRDPNRPPSRSAGGPSGWSWIVVAVIVVVILWLVFGSRGSHQTMANPAHTNAGNNQNGAAITDVGQLASSDAKQLIGKTVDLPAATVVDVASSGAVLIDANGKQILVVNAPAANTTAANGTTGPAETNGGAWKKDHPAGREQVQENGAGQLANRGKGKSETGLENPAPLSQEHTSAFKKGDSVTVQGTVEQMPSEHDAMTQFNLSTDEAARVGDSKVYIRADSLQPAAK